MPRLSLKHFGNEIFGVFGNIQIFRIGIVAIFNFGVGCFDIIGLKGWPSNNKGKSDNA